MKQQLSFATIWRLLCAGLSRTILMYRSRLPSLIINWVVIFPLLYGFSFAYIQGPAYFATETALRTSELFAGNVLLLLNGLSYDNTIELLTDLLEARTIDAIRLAMPLWVDLLRRILFVIGLNLLLIPAYFPVSQIVTGSLVISAKLSWPKLIATITTGALWLSVMHLYAATRLSTIRDEMHYWARVILPLEFIGGFWVPLYAFRKLHWSLTAFAYLNPLTYITEGARNALLQDTRFINSYTCATVLIVYALLFGYLTYRQLYSRLDHVGT